jgi:hypothetical protein
LKLVLVSSFIFVVPGMDNQTAVAVQSLIDSQVITETTAGKNVKHIKVKMMDSQVITETTAGKNVKHVYKGQID